MMITGGFFVIYQSVALPIVYTARLFSCDGPSGINMQSLLFTNDSLDSLRSRIPPHMHRIVVTGVTVPAGNTLVEVWI